MSHTVTFVVVRGAFDDIILWDCRNIDFESFERFVIHTSKRDTVIMAVYRSKEYRIENDRLYPVITYAIK